LLPYYSTFRKKKHFTRDGPLRTATLVVSQQSGSLIVTCM